MFRPFPRCSPLDSRVFRVVAGTSGLQVGLHGKAAAEALQSGAERVRRELQAAGQGDCWGCHMMELVLLSGKSEKHVVKW